MLKWENDKLARVVEDVTPEENKGLEENEVSFSDSEDENHEGNERVIESVADPGDLSGVIEFTELDDEVNLGVINDQRVEENVRIDTDDSINQISLP